MWIQLYISKMGVLGCILRQHGRTMSGSQGVGLADVLAQSLRSYGPHPIPAHDNQGHTGKGAEEGEGKGVQHLFTIILVNNQIQMSTLTHPHIYTSNTHPHLHTKHQSLPNTAHLNRTVSRRSGTQPT